MKGIISDKKSIALTLVASLVVGLFGGVQSARMANAAENQRNLSGLQHTISSDVIRHAAKTAGEGESAYAYYNDFNSLKSSEELAKVAVASSGSSLTLENDIQYGGYLKHATTDGNKSLVMNFANENNDVAKLNDYTVEIDVALKAGTEAGSQSELVFTDTNFDDKITDSAVSGDYIFKLGTGVQATSAAAASQRRNRAVTGKVWYINNSTRATNQVKLPDGIWLTIKLTVKTDSVTSNKTLDWEIIRRGTAVTIEQSETPINLGAVTTGMLKGIYALTGNGGEALVDNIRVSRYSETRPDDRQFTYGDTVSLKNEDVGTGLIQWYRTDDKNDDGVKINGATGRSYTLGQQDAGNYVYAIVDNKTKIFFENRVKGIDITISRATIDKKEYDTTTAVNRNLVTLTFEEVVSGNTVSNALDYDTSLLTFDSASVGNSKTVSGKIILTGEWANCYELINGGRIHVPNCEIIKGTPPYTVPTGLTARVGQTLENVALPSGFKWNTPSTSLDGAGQKTFTATYTPSDTANYNVVSNVSITIAVLDGSSTSSAAPGANATANPSGSPVGSIRPSGSPAASASIHPSGSPMASASIRPSGSPSIPPSASPTATPKPTRTPVPDDPNYPDDPDYPDDPGYPDDPYEDPLPEVDAAELAKNKLGLNKKIRLTWESKTLCVSWGTVSGVEGYDVYAAVVGDDFTNDTIAKSLDGDEEDSINVKKIDGDSLDKDMYYKVKVRAYRMIDDRKQGIGSSLTMYIAARKDSYYTNVKKIKVKKSSYSLKKGKTAKINPTLVKVTKSKTLLKTPGTKVRYISSNPAVARVNENGKIKAVKKGSCTIYAIALNGVRKKISVKVTN